MNLRFVALAVHDLPCPANSRSLSFSRFSPLLLPAPDIIIHPIQHIPPIRHSTRLRTTSSDWCVRVPIASDHSCFYPVTQRPYSSSSSSSSSSYSPTCLSRTLCRPVELLICLIISLLRLLVASSDQYRRGSVPSILLNNSYCSGCRPFPRTQLRGVLPLLCFRAFLAPSGTPVRVACDGIFLYMT